MQEDGGGRSLEYRGLLICKPYLGRQVSGFERQEPYLLGYD